MQAAGCVHFRAHAVHAPIKCSRLESGAAHCPFGLQSLAKLAGLHFAATVRPDA